MAEWQRIGEYWDTLGLITHESDPKKEYETYRHFLDTLPEDDNKLDFLDDTYTLTDFFRYICRLQDDEIKKNKEL